MESIYLKKNINSKNKDSKKNNIIYPNIKGNINPLSKDFLNFLKRKEFSNNFIYARAFNKVKTRNMKLYKFPKEPKKISLKKSISTNKINSMNNTLFIPKQSNRNNNKNKSEESYVSPAYISDDIKERNFQTNKIAISKENNIIIENKKESDKSLGSIKNLWESLCVPMTYCELFHVILSQLDEIDKNKLIENEFNDLNELKNNIDTLLCIIKMRIETLNELKDMNNNLKLIFKKESEESNDLLVKNMSNKIEKLRNYTISICFCMKKIKNKIYDGNRIGKYDMEKIAKRFKFDKNYLIKMKEEMNFLKDGNAKYFFNIVEDQTPFLVKASEEDPNANGDPFIHLVPMSKEVREKIEKCNYIIYQELISYQNKDFKENKFRPISPLLNYYNNIENINMKLNSSKYNIFNNNILLQRIKSSYKRGNYENDINFNLPKILKDNNYSSSLLKENSCINFEIKKENIKNNNLFIEKEKEKKINTKNNNYAICNNISTVIGRNNIDINLGFYKKIPKISNSINIKKISSSPSIYSQKNLKVIIYNKSINKFNEKYYKSYCKKIPQQEIDMFQIQNNLMQSTINGISPYILLIKEILEENSDKNIEDKIERNTIYGICSLFYILNKNKVSIKIVHISTIINFNYSNYLNDLRKLYKIFIDFIVEEFYFDELFIEYNKEKANQELIDIFVNYLNFNVEMTNRESDFNINININMSNFCTSKENGAETLNYNEIEKNVLILRKNNKNNEKINKVFSTLIGKNLFNIFSALIMIDTNSLISIDDEILKQKQNDIFSNLYINIEAVNYLLKLDNKTNINYIYNKITSLDQLMKIFLQNNMSTEEIPLSAAEHRYNMLSCILNSNINTDFSNSNFFNNYNIYNSTSYLNKKTGIYYNFIKPEKIYVMFSENFETIFYHIIHNNMALFFVQFNNKQKKNFLGNNNNIYAKIADIYKEMLNKQIIGELNNKIIWIPCFNIYRHFKYLTNNNSFTVHEYIKVSNNIIFSKTKEQLKSFDIIFKNKSSFQVEPEINKDIIIDSDFILGLINNANIFKNLSEQMSSFKDSKIYYDNSTEKINCEKYKSKLKDYSSISNIEIRQLNKEINKDELPYVIFLNYVKESDFKKNKSK